MGWRGDEEEVSPLRESELTAADRDALKAKQAEVRAEAKRRFEEWMAGT
jgi:hypothetical protein